MQHKVIDWNVTLAAAEDLASVHKVHSLPGGRTGASPFIVFSLHALQVCNEPSMFSCIVLLLMTACTVCSFCMKFINHTWAYKAIVVSQLFASERHFLRRINRRWNTRGYLTEVFEVQNCIIYRYVPIYRVYTVCTQCLTHTHTHTHTNTHKAYFCKEKSSASLGLELHRSFPPPARAVRRQVSAG